MNCPESRSSGQLPGNCRAIEPPNTFKSLVTSAAIELPFVLIRVAPATSKDSLIVHHASPAEDLASQATKDQEE